MFILPINLLFGKRLDDRDKAYYKKTTLLNISDNSKVIYIHALMTIVVVIAVLIDQCNDKLNNILLISGNISNETVQ